MENSTERYKEIFQKNTSSQ